MATHKTPKSTLPDQELVEFTVNGTTMLTTLTKKYRERKKWTKPDNKKIISFIPGTIKELFVKEGDMVAENDKLLVLEAMKMMNVITAPTGGVVKKINIAPGIKVANGTVLIELG